MDKGIKIYKTLNLEEKLRIFELICMNDVFVFLNAENKDIAFEVEPDGRKFPSKDLGFWATLNGLKIQFNIDLSQATACCSKNIDNWGNWNTTLESFLEPIAKKKKKLVKKAKREN